MLKRPVVIKALLSNDDPDLAAQSVKEREFLAAIKHANIVAIYDFFTVGTEGYIVMEYVQGKTLYQIIEDQGGPLQVPDAIGYILGILPAFTYLSKLELVYCDFKPQNVMLEALKDGSRIVKLIDLGTVIKYESHPKDVYGTAGFFAPEAVRTPSHETDLYSICRTLAWMVTLMELDAPPFGMPPSEHYQAFRDHLALYRLLVKGTHPNPERRFHSAEDLGDQLAGILRLMSGGAPGIPVTSRLFVSNTLTATGRLGPVAEAALDERDSAIDVLRSGDRALRSGNSTGAIGFFNQALRVNSHSVDGYLRLADVLIERGEVALALAEIAKAQRVAPGNWKIAWYTGRVLEAQGDLVAAADQYNELISELPGELPPRQALARVRARQGDDTTAMGFYAEVLRADPGNIEAILGMTTSLLNLQRWDEVAHVLNGISEAAAKYVEAQLMLCDLFLYRMAPLTSQNVLRAAQAVHGLAGRTEDPRYYLARGDVYRAAQILARTKQLPANMTLPGVADTSERSLGFAAEASYNQYLRAAQNPPNREEIIRRRFEVAPWRLW
jgi:serine/threonine-protein kinase PknG